jgi:hypothetical protein
MFSSEPDALLKKMLENRLFVKVRGKVKGKWGKVKGKWGKVKGKGGKGRNSFPQ